MNRIKNSIEDKNTVLRELQNHSIKQLIERGDQRLSSQIENPALIPICWDLLRTHIFPRTRELPQFPISPKPLFLSKNRLRNPSKPVLKQNKKLCTYAHKKSLHICKVFGKKKKSFFRKFFFATGLIFERFLAPRSRFFRKRIEEILNDNNLAQDDISNYNSTEDISNYMEHPHSETLDDISKPTWENIVESPIIDYVSPVIPMTKYKLKLKYGGIFRLSKKTFKKMYCFGSQKCIYIDTWSYNFSQLNEEVIKRYSSKSNPKFSICYIDMCAPEKSFIELDSEEKFMAMLTMYENEKEVTVYVTTENNTKSNNFGFGRQKCDDRDEPLDEDDSDYLPSEESYYSHLSSDNEYEEVNDDDEANSFIKNSQSITVESKFENVTCFKRALNHYAIINEFDYFIQKVTRHDSQQSVKTLIVKKMVEAHTCTRSNKGGNKRATQGWIANVITNKLRSDGDVSLTELRKWIMKTYNVGVPYQKVFRGKQQVHIDMYACSQGFLAGCRPYIALDACHLKGKFNGVLAAATGIDGNNSIFLVAYAVLESENTQSWTWFLETLRKSIGMPDGLVMSSDMQKGLEVAMMNVYPNIEHRECIRHLSSNFKKHFHNEFLNNKIWDPSKTYCPTEHDKLLKDVSDLNKDAIAYLNKNHKKIWSRSKFGTTSKCAYNTNNISESFNSWIGALRYQPVLDLLDGIREKIMKHLNKKRMLVKKLNGTLVPIAKNHLNDISKNLGEYQVCRSCEYQAEVKCQGKRWDVYLDKRKCSCRVWQVTGLPCEKYVDQYFTIEKFKDAYEFQIAPLPGKDQWMQKDGEKIYPPIIKRPAGRPRKNRIKASTESKRRHKCPRCGEYGHREKTCKNPAFKSLDTSETSKSKRKCK
ncbi:hypothetical protein LXL04_034207 [Taraxacum kok-saghyz]